MPRSARQTRRRRHLDVLARAHSSWVRAVENDDVLRADAIAAAQSTTRAVVINATACTGLAMLADVDGAITSRLRW